MLRCLTNSARTCPHEYARICWRPALVACGIAAGIMTKTCAPVSSICAMTHSMCAMTRSDAPWLILWCYVPWLMCHDSLCNACVLGCEKFICGISHSCVPWLIHMCRDSYICEIILNSFTCALTHPSVKWLILGWYNSFSLICDTTYSSCTIYERVTWLIHIYHDSFIYDTTHLHVTQLLHIWHTPSSHVTHDPFTCSLLMCIMTLSHLPWLIHVCHDSFIICAIENGSRLDLYVPWLIYVCRDWFVCTK